MDTPRSFATYVLRVKREREGLVYELVHLRTGDVWRFTDLHALSKHLAALSWGLR